jgi:hypothetical protein
MYFVRFNSVNRVVTPLAYIGIYSLDFNYYSTDG